MQRDQIITRAAPTLLGYRAQWRSANMSFWTTIGDYPDQPAAEAACDALRAARPELSGPASTPQMRHAAE